MEDNLCVWDELTKLYDGHQTEKMSYDEAENVLIAWPPILRFLKEYLPRPPQPSHILDYGCGTGGLAKHLHQEGYKVTGVDPSEGMIRAAAQNMGKRLRFIAGDEKAAASYGPFNAVVAMMVFQFIENHEQVLRGLVGSIAPGGSIALATFNPEWIRACVERGYNEEYRFHGFADSSCLGKGLMDFGEKGAAPLFIRNAAEYDAVLRPLGLEKVMEERPPFTEAFVREYHRPPPVHIPEFLILGYRKTS
jgi:SAM-dependent methyltransferase